MSAATRTPVIIPCLDPVHCCGGVGHMCAGCGALYEEDCTCYACNDCGALLLCDEAYVAPEPFDFCALCARCVENYPEEVTP